jgi:hypothetical protein
VRSLLLIAAAVVVVSGCGSEAPSPPASTTSSSHGTAAQSASPRLGIQEPALSATPAESVDPIGDVECTGGATTGSNDYPAGIEGGAPTVEGGMRALQGVLPTDEIVVAADRAGVVRDGRTIFISWWSESSTGNWLLVTFVVCGDAGIQLTAPN